MSGESILVLGAGELGLSVLRGLTTKNGEFKLDAGAKISVLLRAGTISSTDPDKAQSISELRSLGVSLVAGELVDSSVEDLALIFRLYSTVISCSGFIGGKGLQIKLARAALSAGVKRYFPWQFGVDYDVIGRGSAQDLFDEQLDVRDILRAQTATEWVIVSTGMFTSFLFEPFFGVVDLAKGQVNALGSLDAQLTVTAAADIGVLTTEVVFAQPRIKNQVVYTAGDTVSYRELADKLDAALGITVQRNVLTVAELEAALAADPEDALKKYRAVFAGGKGVAWPKEATYNAQYNIPVVDVDAYICDHLLRK